MKKVLMFFLLIMIAGAFSVIVQNPGTEETKQVKQEVFFDAAAYVGITEEELIGQMGEADGVEDWIYNNKYQMRTYSYGSREFIFGADTAGNYIIARINIYEEIPCVNKDKMYELFNLEEPTSRKDTGVAIREYYSHNVHDVWVTEYDNETIKNSKITYVNNL